MRIRLRLDNARLFNMILRLWLPLSGGRTVECVGLPRWVRWGARWGVRWEVPPGVRWAPDCLPKPKGPLGLAGGQTKIRPKSKTSDASINVQTRLRLYVYACVAPSLFYKRGRERRKLKRTKRGRERRKHKRTKPFSFVRLCFRRGSGPRARPKLKQLN